MGSSRASANDLAFIWSAAAQIGVSIPEDAEPVEQPPVLVGISKKEEDSGNGTGSSRSPRVVAGGVLYEAMRVFLSRLVKESEAVYREQVADLEEGGEGEGAVASKGLLVPAHVRAAVLRDPRFDFLTLRFLGKENASGNEPPVDVVRDEVFENRRGCFLFDQLRFSAKKLLPTDLPPWSTVSGAPTIDRMAFPVPSGWEWISDWAVDMRNDVDADGFAYAVNFKARDWSGTPTPSHYVCRRAWTRTRRAVKNGSASLAPVDPDAAIVLQMPILVRSCTLDRQKVDIVASSLAKFTPNSRVLIPPYSVNAILQELEYDKNRMQAVKHMLPFLDKEGVVAALFQITHHCNRLELLEVVGKESFLNEFLTIY
ncbi:hypothetical protein HDU98_008038 [Podochytrium sp. JEL0797]|nr:hypothetical protein HDU98_008038 [Podochytrium sp. JEL0797]